MNEAKPLLPQLNPVNALSPQLRVDGGELSSECVIVDHFLDSLAHLSRSYVMSIVQNIINCIFTLVALCRATSAKL